MNCRWHKFNPETTGALGLFAACPRSSDISKREHDLATDFTKKEMLKVFRRLQLHASLIRVILQARECTHDNPESTVQGCSEVKAMPESEGQRAGGASLLQMCPSHDKRETDLLESSTHVSQPLHNLVHANVSTSGQFRNVRVPSATQGNVAI